MGTAMNAVISYPNPAGNASRVAAFFAQDPSESTDIWLLLQDVTSPNGGGARASRIESGFYTYLGAILAPPELASEPLLSLDVPGALADLRQTLGLNTSQMASVLHVSRQAIYDWSHGKTVKPENRRRIESVLEIAQAWRQRSPYNLGELLREALPDASPLLSLLQADPLDADAIFTLLDRFAEIRAKTENAKPPSAQVLAERFDLAPLPEHAYQRNLRSASRAARKRS